MKAILNYLLNILYMILFTHLRACRRHNLLQFPLFESSAIKVSLIFLKSKQSGLMSDIPIKNNDTSESKILSKNAPAANCLKYSLSGMP